MKIVTLDQKSKHAKWEVYELQKYAQAFIAQIRKV